MEVSGFEALPPDLAVLLAAETARERFGEGLAEADLEVTISGPPGMPRPSDMISGGTLQSLAAAAGGDDAAAVTDPAALITDAARAEEVRRVSPINVMPRQGANGAVIAPMAPAAFINPAVIQRTAALTGAEPFRYREGIPLEGPPITLPLRFMAAGLLSGTQAAVAAAAHARPAIRNRVGDVLTQILPGSGFGPSGERLEGWSWHMTVGGPHDRRARCARRRRRRRPPRIPRDRADAGRGRVDACGAGPDAGPRWMPDARDGARHRVARALRARAAAVLGHVSSARSSESMAEESSKTSP